ncbi:ribonucleotide-diphosphate reductase subunit alpha [Planctomycetota bacterium]|nr:ribonucleotide-diphosphate reductase subunit alpha [Planctomycetota bacterium]
MPTALGPFLVLLLVWAGFGLAVAACAGTGDPWTFFSWRNQTLILAQSAIVAVGACGMVLVVVAGGIDLAAGSMIALCSVVTALVLAHSGCPPLGGFLFALLAVLGVGAACGALSGALIAGLRLAPFIVTLGMLSMARGAAKGAADNQTVNFDHPWLADLMTPTAYHAATDPWWQAPLIVAPGVWIAAGLVAVTWFLMERTVFGRNAAAIGSNPAAARLCGIHVAGHTIAIYAWCGLCLGLAGLLETAKLSQGDPTTASGRELDIIAAVVVGGASLSGGRGSVIAAAVGAVLMVVLRSGGQLLEWNPWVQEILIGVVIIVAVAVDRWRRGRSE